MSDQPLSRIDEQPLDRPSEPLSIEQVFRAVMASDIGPEKVAVMKELLAMSAERQFATAFVALQSELPVIVAKTIIPNRGKYERFEDLWDAVGPILNRHGFSVSFNQENKDNRIIEVCHLSHAGGHTRSNSFAVRAGGKADSEIQADCKAATTAKRNALCNALNIVIRQDCLTSDTDAAIEGAIISRELAEKLAERINLTNSNREKFLKLAGVDTFFQVTQGKYEVLDQLLREKEARGK